MCVEEQQTRFFFHFLNIFLPVCCFLKRPKEKAYFWSASFLMGRQFRIGARIGACAELNIFCFPVGKQLAQQFLAQPRHKNRRF
jgi:hypothetical protein